MEALVRWNHPEMELATPNEFIPIAERSGLIVPISDFVLNQACKDYSRFKQHFPRLESITVNFSPRQFRDQTLVERVTSIVSTNSLGSSNIEIAITDFFIDSRDGGTLETLYELSSLDFKLALDDFGAGYSSLEYLKKCRLIR